MSYGMNGWCKPDGDLISREAAIAIADSSDYVGLSVDDVKKVTDEVVKGLKQLPSAQPEIIACGDCKHWICHDRRCGFWNHGVKPLDWCCHAERRTDERSD